ncbi:hypothetical protein PHYPSEUDO_009013 [Phytophthora pseudosyringae]|uniref:Uncharacterized protein n=1 Tax=Phytophthora pseudosyringae TaxID=221518 RepID=A0A8T1W9W4_9STRA|nr:hypothetical protein PHYPSEUDO_009013 [Phytophthora pseudosyringae]
MLAYVVSRPHTKVEMVNERKNPRPSPPPNSPLLVTPDVVISVESWEDEHDQNDGIDFSRVRAELDRLLEEGLRESDVVGADEVNTIEVYHQAENSITVTQELQSGLDESLALAALDR